MQAKMTFNISLPAYCDHAAIIHDGQTWLALLDAGNDVVLWRWNWYKSPAVWEQLWKLSTDPNVQWDKTWKAGAGHDLALGPFALGIAIPYKILNTTPAIGGTCIILFDRDKIEPMKP